MKRLGVATVAAGVAVGFAVALLVERQAPQPPPETEPKLLVGVSDDSLKWSSAGAPHVRKLGLRALRIWLPWKRGRRTLSPRDVRELASVRRRAPGIRVVLGVNGFADDAPRTERARDDFCAFTSNALERFPRIRDVIVWNEANSKTFWPQESAPDAYYALLARCYDVLHALPRRVNVLTSTASRHDPGTFIRGVGAAYRASGRTRRIADSFGHHPYPRHSGESPAAVHESLIGQGDYDRLVDALSDAFDGTAQPLPGERGVAIWYLEDGFQTVVPRARTAAYTGAENVRVVSPEAQAAHLRDAVRIAYCQPHVRVFLNFKLADETRLGGWQSGVLWADGTAKPAYDAFRRVASEVESGRVDCRAVGRMLAAWRAAAASVFHSGAIPRT